VIQAAIGKALLVLEEPIVGAVGDDDSAAGDPAARLGSWAALPRRRRSARHGLRGPAAARFDWGLAALAAGGCRGTRLQAKHGGAAPGM
jgi:hypothetical protein